MIPKLLKNKFTFPDPSSADEDGIVAWGGDLSPYRLIQAYQSGIFPWYGKNDPIIWWSTNPRLIMELDDFKISRSLKKSIKKFEYKFDTNFKEVIKQCGSVKRDKQNGTWIQKEIIEAYCILHDMGIAHSVESYIDGKLVGGLYGVVVGKVFCGESMFSIVSDASKSAYATLIKHLKLWGYDFIDCQVPTEHLKHLGAKEINRETFLNRLNKSNKVKLEHSWKIEDSVVQKV